MTRVAVIGSTGQLGSDLVKVLQGRGYVVFPLSHTDVECTDPGSVQTTIAAIRPDIAKGAERDSRAACMRFVHSAKDSAAE